MVMKAAEVRIEGIIAIMQIRILPKIRGYLPDARSDGSNGSTISFDEIIGIPHFSHGGYNDGQTIQVSTVEILQLFSQDFTVNKYFFHQLYVHYPPSSCVKDRKPPVRT